MSGDHGEDGGEQRHVQRGPRGGRPLRDGPAVDEVSPGPGQVLPQEQGDGQEEGAQPRGRGQDQPRHQEVRRLERGHRPVRGLGQPRLHHRHLRAGLHHLRVRQVRTRRI